MASRISASEEKRKELAQLLGGGVDGEESILSQVVRKAAELALQKLLEEEVTDFLGRGHYERREGKQKAKKGYRNGYEALKIKTAEGVVKVRAPQVRDTEEPFSSKLAKFFWGNTDVLEALASEMYVRGMSTRDVEDALLEVTGEMILSRTAVSKVSEVLNEEYEQFVQRDLSMFDVEYLFLDAIYESIQERYGSSKAVLCAWGICRNGRKILLHLQLGNQESFGDWLDFLRDMRSRGLRIPTSITSDGAPGLIKAIDQVFPKSLRIRCWVHRMKNFSNKVAKKKWPEIKAQLYVIRDSENFDQGMKHAQDFIDRYRSEFPTLVRAVEDDLEALLNILKLPHKHRRYTRTTNLIERSFVEERRRTKVIPTFLTEKSAIKLVFSTLIRVSKRWRNVKFDEIHCVYLDRLRRKLGIEGKETEPAAIEQAG